MTEDDGINDQRKPVNLPKVIFITTQILFSLCLKDFLLEQLDIYFILVWYETASLSLLVV